MSAGQIDAEKLEEALEYYGNGRPGLDGRMAYIFTAARAHLSTLPRVKEVEVWHVESFHDGCTRVDVRSTPYLAENLAILFKEDGRQCIRVTGPHKQKVPA